MARANLSVQVIKPEGLEPAFIQANTDGLSVENNGNMYIEVVNGHTSATHTATIDHPGQIDGLQVANRAVAIPPAESRKIGPFTARYNQPGTTTVHIDFESVTGLSIGAFRIE